MSCNKAVLYNKKRKTVDLIELIIILLLISPILVYYNIPATTLAVPTVLNFISIIAIVISIVCKRHFFFERKGHEAFFFVFCFWFFFQNVIQSLVSRHEVIVMSISFINALVVLAIILILPPRINAYKKTCIKIYIFVCRVAIVLFLADFLGDLFGYHINFSIPLLSLQEPYVSAFDSYSPGLFSESSHFAQFIIPLVIIRLFSFNSNNRTREIMRAVFTTIVCLLSLSGNGIVCCLVIWLCFFFYQAKKRSNHGLVIIIVGIVVSIIIVAILSRIPSFMDVINRLFVDLSGSAYSYTKADYRIYRGFDYFFKLPTIRKVFGIGYKALESYSIHTGITSIFDREFLFEYLNAMCQILIYLGIIGFVFFYSCIIRMYRRSTIIGKVIVIIFVALTVSSSIFLDSTMMMFFLLVFAFQNNNEPEQIP